MTISRRLVVVCLVVIALSLCAIANAWSPKVTLGKWIFYDKNLSSPPGQSCATCHSPMAGWAEPHRSIPCSQGAFIGRYGNRNAQNIGYLAGCPNGGYDKNGEFIGGFFWDGRARTLVDQAKGPFLNPYEMNNANPGNVVVWLKKSSYWPQFLQVYGPLVCTNVDKSYAAIADALAAFEKSGYCNQFDSRYDDYLAGDNKALSAKELRGLALFEGKGNCASCHPCRPDKYGNSPMFTDYSYDNVGAPKNARDPFYYMNYNTLGLRWVDLGLYWTTGRSCDVGRFKVPTLRNCAKTAPYMHNGYFDTLTEVVNFYNTRDVDKWPEPEVASNVNHTELGNLKLTSSEVSDIVAFLGCLTDRGCQCGCGCLCGCGWGEPCMCGGMCGCDKKM